MDITLLQNMSIILITAVIILLIFNKLKLPSMIGLFITGIVLSYFINSTSLITNLSELGVIFLLFIIGLEFSIEKFSAIKKYAVAGGLLQVLITTLLVTLIFTLLSFPLNKSIFIGFLISFSSTAIVMKVIQQKKLGHALQGRVTLGILIFQDIAVIVVILLIPILGGEAIEFNAIPEILLKVVGLGVIIFAFAKWFIPLALRDSAKTKNRDLFILLTLFICMGTTFATSLIGISPELGAFLAGLMISNTDYSHQTLGYIQPFQDVFMSIFFISIGLMIDVGFFLTHLPAIILLTVGVLFVNFIGVFITGIILKLPTKVTVSISLLLCGIGEFSFVLAKEGLQYGLISISHFNLFLAVSILTMSLSPFLQNLTPRMMKLLIKIPYFRADEELKTIPEEKEEKLEDHVILVGMGVNGKNMARACKVYKIPYVIIDTNPIIVEKQQEMGIPVIYGNASNENVLKDLKITSAKCIVISASTYDGTLKTVDAARRLNPDIHIIVRTRYLKNMEEVYDAGADEVIPEEFETSILMFTKIMNYYDKDVEEITNTVNNLRADNYDVFRSASPEEITASLNDNLSDVIVDYVNVYEDDTPISDFKFDEFNLTVTSVIRDDNTLININSDFQLNAYDVILFTGKKKDIVKFNGYID